MNLFEKKFLSKLEEDVAEAPALDPAADVPAAPVVYGFNIKFC